jgi:cellulose synthase/poly-beta-1,6-N-acetylglucosamine synthase-like glycosyltransferase
MSVSLVVPAYNEEGMAEGLLQHLVSLERSGIFDDIVLVDDGSTDATREKVLEALRGFHGEITFVSLEKNSDKVGAIATGAGLAEGDKVLLTDADTRIVNPEKIVDAERYLEEEGLEGLAFQIVPKNGEGLKEEAWSRLQDLDYSVGRLAYHFTTGKFLRRNPDDSNVRCTPGAGSMYRRDVLLNTLENHSGKHAGDDIETAAISQLSSNSDIGYYKQLKFLSHAPGNYRDLLSQRTRWNRGALQAYSQEKRNFFSEISSFSRYGLISLYELGLSLVTPLLFVMILVSAVSGGLSSLIDFLSSVYLFDFTLNLVGGSYSLAKQDVGDARSMLLLPLMPVYRLSIFYPAKLLSLYDFTLTAMKDRFLGVRELGVEISDADIFDMSEEGVPEPKIRVEEARPQIR